MNYRNESNTCTIDQWFCNGLISCEECKVAYDHLKTYWMGWAELHGHDPNTVELIPKTSDYSEVIFDVFVGGE